MEDESNNFGAVFVLICLIGVVLCCLLGVV